MIGALFVGIAVGFVLSIPPGPIAIAVMRQAIDGKYKPGLKIGLGASTMDMIYTLVAVFASSALVSSLQRALTGNGWLRVAFQIACVITLVVLGIRYFRATTKNMVESAQQEKAQEERAKKMGFRSDYLIGVLMSVTNLASPTFLPTLIFVAGYLGANGMIGKSAADNIAYAVGFGAGAWLWFLALLRTLYQWRTRLSSGFVTRLYQFAGWSFIVFAAILVFNVVVNTDWNELL